MSLQLQSQLMKPQRLQPFTMVDSLSPTFQDIRTSFLKDSKEYFCTDPSIVMPSHSSKQQRQIPENIIQILSRQFEERTTADNSHVYKFLSRYKFFRELSDKLSSEVTKYMLRQGRPKLYKEGDLITSCGKRIRTIRILLQGEVGIIFEEQTDQESPDLWQVLHKLVDNLGKEPKNYKIKHTITANKKNIHESLEKSQLFKRQTLRHDLDIQNLKMIEPQTLLDFIPLTSYEPKHSLTLVVTKPNTLLLNIGLDQFYQSLLFFYNLKQNQVIKLFRKVPIFNSFENPKLKLLIEKLKIVQMKKNEFIYKEKDIVNCFYLLTEGEVEITKTVDLLAQNPNNFYKNRVKVSREKLDLNIKILPYANFNGVYNYQNETKLVRLSLLNPISVFGEQQLIEGTARQVNAKVLSLTAKMYEITLADIQEFCAKISGNQAEKQKKMTIIDFFSIIQESITMKKILFRQNLLAEMLNHENKAKYKVLLASNQSKTQSKAFRSVGRRRRAASSGTPLNKLKSTEDEAPPAFNNFNFTDFMTQKEEQGYQSLSPSFTPQESRIAKLTHSKFIEPDDSNKKKTKDKAIRLRHVSRQDRRSTKTTLENMATIDSIGGSPFRPSQPTLHSNPKITLEEPLFTMNYFQKQQQLEKRLVAVAKKQKLDNIYKKSQEKYKFY